MNSQENMLKHKHTNAFLNNYETNSKKVDNINNFLEKETTNSKSESWNKMDKTGKIKLLNEYVDSIIEKHNLELTDITELKKYLSPLILIFCKKYKKISDEIIIK